MNEGKKNHISLLMRLLPEDPAVDLSQVEQSIRKMLPDDCSLERTEIRPFAFGLKALMCKITVPDVEGNADRIEDLLRSVPQVQGVEFVNMSRIL